MSKSDRILEIKEMIRQNEKDIKELNNKLIKLNAPKGYKKSTSYNDYDTIRGGQSGMKLDYYLKELERLETLLDLNKSILKRLVNEIDEEEYLLLLDKEEQVKFLREIQGYTQQETADKMFVSVSTVRRIEKRVY